MKNLRLIIILLAIVVLLLIPLVAMQFTNEVDWSIMDFTIMGILLSHIRKLLTCIDAREMNYLETSLT